MSRRPAHSSRGFTLLETVVALAILAMALMAIFDLNAGAVSNHAYTKKLTVATLLARSKMTDLEQQLHDKGFSSDDDEESGDFSEEGWSQFKWRARILAPKTQGVSPQQLIGAIFNVPMGGEAGGEGGLGDLVQSMLPPGATQSGTGVDQALGAMGPMAGMMQTQFTQMVDQITKSVREVHLTVSWRDGTQVESFDLVTHVVSLGPGSDRNGGAAAEATQGAPSASGGDPNTPPTQDGLHPSAHMYVPGSPAAVPPQLIVSRGGAWIHSQTGQRLVAAPSGGAPAAGGWQPNPGVQRPGGDYFPRQGATQ
jgi:general secretion pathway protein I